MTHLWVRAETRANEDRVGITPEGVAYLIDQGIVVTVERDPTRVFDIADYASAGASIVGTGNWVSAPEDAIVFGLKELPESDAPLRHRHIMFGHAYKDQSGAAEFLGRFGRGGGTLLDLEYLTDDEGRRVAAFGHWAGFAGAAISCQAFGCQATGGALGAVGKSASPEDMIAETALHLGDARPRALVIGAKGRVGRGATEALEALGLSVTAWDVEETAHGGPFPEILEHDILLNCILAMPGVPLFVGPDDVGKERMLRVIGDIACDPTSPFSPLPIYVDVTTWADPVTTVADVPRLDVMAIDNLPSLLPRDSSVDFAAQLLPHLAALATGSPVWDRAEAVFSEHIARL